MISHKIRVEIFRSAQYDKNISLIVILTKRSKGRISNTSFLPFTLKNIINDKKHSN